MKHAEFQVERDNANYTFSLGEVVESLQGAGVETDTAIRIARSAEKHFRQIKGKKVKLESLVKHLATELEEEVGKDSAERFRKQTPPFVPISVDNESSIEPFSLRTLARSLAKLGLKLKEAYAIANQVEQMLRSKGYEQVSERELMHLTALALEASYGRDLRHAYELKLRHPIDLQVVEASGNTFPFSRGILAQSLMAIGLAPEASHAFGKQLEDILWHKGLTSISRDGLYLEVKNLLLAEAGEVFAQRYELMRSVRHSNRPFIILLGGAPGVGKSSLAYELAYRLGIRRIVSSDAIRQALRSLISPQLSPGLHRSSFEAWQEDLLPGESADKPKRKRVIRGFQSQVQQLSTALTGIIQRSIDEAVSVIIEGVHLVPGVLPLYTFKEATLLELVLIVDDKDSHRQHFVNREEQTRQRRAQNSYLEHFAEIRMIHDFIKERAKAEAIAMINMVKFEEATDKALEYVLNAALTKTRDEQHG